MYNKSGSDDFMMGMMLHGVTNPGSCPLDLPCKHLNFKFTSLSKMVFRTPTTFQSAGKRKKQHIFRKILRSCIQFWFHSIRQNAITWPHTAAKKTGNTVFILGGHGSAKNQGFYYCRRRGEKMLGNIADCLKKSN